MAAELMVMPVGADGTCDGPTSREVVIDPRTPAVIDVGVGDMLYVGGTLASTREQRFEVVGISPTFSHFLGTSTVTLPLAELQTLSELARGPTVRPW